MTAAFGRRALIAAISTLRPVRRACAYDAPEITRRVRLEFIIGDQPPQSITVGLYGKEAPMSVRAFEGLCAGTLAAAPGLTYSGSVVSRVVRNEYIEAGKPAAGDAKSIEREIDGTGYVRSTIVNRADALVNTDTNTLSHDRPGLCSMRRGGGAFEFLLTPRANSELDKDFLVIGEVIEGQTVVDKINDLPTRLPSPQSDAAGLASLYGLKAGTALGVAGLVGRGPVGSQGAAFEALRVTSALAAFSFVGGEDPRIRSRELANRPLTKVRLQSTKLLAS